MFDVSMLSPKVRALMSLRMDAAHGTPTVWEKIGALFNADGTNNTAVLAGDKADLQKALGGLEALFGPAVIGIETDALADVSQFLTGILKAVPSFTSVSQALQFALNSAKALGGPIGSQIGGLSQSALLTLVSAALTAAGHLNVPVA